VLYCLHHSLSRQWRTPQQARHSAVQKTHLVRERKKKTTSKNEKKKPPPDQTNRFQQDKNKTFPHCPHHKSKASQTAANLVTEKCTVRKKDKSEMHESPENAEVHKVRV
jgi:murein DD-endopeptidase